jgi:hypothetical protein
MRFKALLTLAFAVALSATAFAQSATLLTPADTQKLLPAAVYYKGQSAPLQIRNSGGVKFPDGSYVLASLVDVSGYSTGIAAKYQGYFITEVPLKIHNGQPLPAGVYGEGFVPMGGSVQFVLTDVGGHEVLLCAASVDAGMRRPRPLQITADPAGGFRLYSGRQFVYFTR